MCLIMTSPTSCQHCLSPERNVLKHIFQNEASSSVSYVRFALVLVPPDACVCVWRAGAVMCASMCVCVCDVRACAVMCASLCLCCAPVCSTCVRLYVWDRLCVCVSVCASVCVSLCRLYVWGSVSVRVCVCVCVCVFVSAMCVRLCVCVWC